MKNSKLTRTIAALMAAAIISAVPFTVCAEEAPAETSSTEFVVPIPENEDIQTTRALEEGDKYAITKLSFKENDGVIPGGYTCVEMLEDTQQALYANGNSRVIILAQNYKEDMQELENFADSTCAMMKLRNYTSACDTIFAEPYETEIAGFRTIVYDCDIIQYEFVDETTKEQIDTFKGRNYFFYSDDDVYALMFDTNAANWEEQSKCVEEFVDAIEIEGAKKSVKMSDGVAIAVIIGVVVVAAAAGVIVTKKKKS